MFLSYDWNIRVYQLGAIIHEENGNETISKVITPTGVFATADICYSVTETLYYQHPSGDITTFTIRKLVQVDNSGMYQIERSLELSGLNGTFTGLNLNASAGIVEGGYNSPSIITDEKWRVFDADSMTEISILSTGSNIINSDVPEIPNHQAIVFSVALNAAQWLANIPTSIQSEFFVLTTYYLHA